ncbi:hypothetical protein J5A66_07635 [Prevotella sp. oral taxon 475]|uniref:hypothetical protein n=1 Tax=Prevotella sp. oral taxon 475 TaxID=712471 RepID=UPI001BA6B414|nr:hypothetical protein [Prevotella sp. oral taxon 475]QUB46838.1 hypothetical protein J5A66_07635 [Prevotella sp. oral taxon 475]
MKNQSTPIQQPANHTIHKSRQSIIKLPSWKDTAKIFNHQPKHLLSHRSTPSSPLLKTSFSTPQNLDKNTLHNPLIINTLQNTLPSLSFCTAKAKKTTGKR